MPQREAPSSPRNDERMTDANGILTQRGHAILQQLWRQVVAGHVNIPVSITNVGNKFTLVPRLHEEGAQTYADHLVFIGHASAGSTGSVTAEVKTASGSKILDTIKVYKDGGSTQAGNTDIVADRLYLWIYSAALDSGAGGLVLK